MADQYAPHAWASHERPTMPGAASTPLHSPRRRVAYAIVGVIVALTGGLGNALVTANLQYLQGPLGAYAYQTAWLPAAYVMTNLSANLVLVKFRQQFGLRHFTEIFLGLYAVIALAHIFVNDLASAIAVRAAHGFAGAALSTLGIFYMIQAFSAKRRLSALVLGLGLGQLPLPLARMFTTELLEFGQWQGLYLFELGLAILALACVVVLKLPPSDRIRTFEKLDAATIVLFGAGAAGLAAVLSLGRYLWWTATPWLGVTLACSIVLVVAAMMVEHYRANPLINTRWLASNDMLRLALAVMLIRVVLSEQSTGAMGFFQSLGLVNDQMHVLFRCMLAGCVLALALSAWLLRPEHAVFHILTAIATMATGAFMDVGATSATRPEQMYLSQFLMAFGSVFFLGPALISGLRVVVTQPRNLVSFVVMFGMAQNLGGLVGSAFLGTFQIVREKYHSSLLNEHLTLADPQVAARVQAYTGAYAHVIGDAAQRQGAALRQLGSVATREANVLAYNDVFLAIGWISLATLAWILGLMAWRRLRPASGLGAGPGLPNAPDPSIPTEPVPHA